MQTEDQASTTTADTTSKDNTKDTTKAGDGTSTAAVEDVSGLKSALETERRARRDAEGRLKELEPLAKAAKDREDAEKSELTKASEALAFEREARTKAEAQLMKYEVGAEKNVPPKLMRFLHGSTKEEMEKAADALLAELGGGDGSANGGGRLPAKPTERLSTGKPSTPLDSEDPMALIARARPNGPFTGPS
jgi:hypothetical protein